MEFYGQPLIWRADGAPADMGIRRACRVIVSLTQFVIYSSTAQSHHPPSLAWLQPEGALTGTGAG